VVVIHTNPLETHRAVEALRIALGLASGDQTPVVVLLGQAPLLLSEDRDDVVDGDILERYLPSLKQLGVLFIVESGALTSHKLEDGFSVEEQEIAAIASIVSSGERVLSFP
jgi:predicted peroxiredoxin